VSIRNGVAKASPKGVFDFIDFTLNGVEGFSDMAFCIADGSLGGVLAILTFGILCAVVVGIMGALAEAISRIT
jgi:hypothetical protein